MSDIWTRLADPLDPADLTWMPGSVTKSGDKAMLLAFVTSRAVMDRLDECLGPANWTDHYETGPSGGVLCQLSVRLEGGEWLTKEDVAENTNIEAVKGGVSGALKRAAVKFGVGRYLYHLDSDWIRIQQGWSNGRGVDVSKDREHIGWCAIPKLPEWALPGGSGRPSKKAEKPAPTGTPVPSAEDRLFKEQQDAARDLAASMGANTGRAANELVQKASGGSLSWRDLQTEPGEVLAALREYRDNGKPIAVDGDQA